MERPQRFRRVGKKSWDCKFIFPSVGDICKHIEETNGLIEALDAPSYCSKRPSVFSKESSKSSKWHLFARKGYWRARSDHRFARSDHLKARSGYQFSRKGHWKARKYLESGFNLLQEKGFSTSLARLSYITKPGITPSEFLEVYQKNGPGSQENCRWRRGKTWLPGKLLAGMILKIVCLQILEHL